MQEFAKYLPEVLENGILQWCAVVPASMYQERKKFPFEHEGIEMEQMKQYVIPFPLDKDKFPAEIAKVMDDLDKRSTKHLIP